MYETSITIVCMSNLLKFFQKNVHTISHHDRYSPVLEFEDVLVVNFDCLYDRERFLRAVDQLLFYLHSVGQGKRFIFISEDGAVLEHTGAVEIIKNIIQVFGLTSDTCLVVCREPIDIPGATVWIDDSVYYWCRALLGIIQQIPIPQGQFTKKFAVWFHRGTVFRLMIAKHLYENHKDSSIISYQEPGVLLDKKMSEYYQDLVDWAEQHTPIVYDQLFPKRVYTLEMVTGTRHPYEEYFMEVICETDVLGTSWITEKTVKNLYIGKPFVVMSGPGTLAKLHRMGFKTFSPWIDESYDSIENHHDRLKAILAEVDRISMLDVNELHNNIRPILEHNRANYLKLLRTWPNENPISRR